MANDWFGKRIILPNTEKVCFFSNTKSNKFWRKIIIFNVLSFWLYKKAVLLDTNITFYDNWFFLIAKLSNISFLIKYIINNSIFDKKLGYTGI